MKQRNITIFFMLMLLGQLLHGQLVDSTIYKQYGYHVGNLGFGSDSLELIIPDIPRGVVSPFTIQVHNFGTEPMTIEDGRTGKFVTVRANPPVLLPNTAGFIEVSLDIVPELPLGPFRAEVSLETNDETARYKFLYLLTNIVENEQGSTVQANYDTIPRLIFEHYNFDFGHLYRGKKIYYSYLYTNMGGQPVVVNRVEVSPGCKLLSPVPEIILPGEQGMVRVRIATRGCVGVQHRWVMLYTNDPVTPVITLGAHGTVRTGAPSANSPGFCKEGPGYF